MFPVSSSSSPAGSSLPPTANSHLDPPFMAQSSSAPLQSHNLSHAPHAPPTVSYENKNKPLLMCGHDLPLEYFDEDMVIYTSCRPLLTLWIELLVILLVDVDLQHELPQRLFIERVGKSIELPVTYEELPPFCSHCSTIGHLVAECRVLKKAQQTHSLNLAAREGNKPKKP